MDKASTVSELHHVLKGLNEDFSASMKLVIVVIGIGRLLPRFATMLGPDHRLAIRCLTEDGTAVAGMGIPSFLGDLELCQDKWQYPKQVPFCIKIEGQARFNLTRLTHTETYGDEIHLCMELV